MISATARYLQLLEPANWSDVQSHLTTLFDCAHGAVLELGVRAGISTTALLAGVEAHGGHVWSVDRDDCAPVWAGHAQWSFIQADSLDEARIIVPAVLDVLWIDTEHTEERTIAELRAWGGHVRPGGVILLHDTDDSSTYPGVRNAISVYCSTRNLTPLYMPGSYGLGVIRL
jgi:predicted O-methyltransferase YrrM